MGTIRLLAAALLAASGAAASAQTFGSPIAGLCLLSRTGAISASRAGQSMQAQLRQMQGALSGQLAQQQAAIDAQRRRLQSQQGSTAPIEYQRRQAALDQQAQALERQQNARFIAAQARGQQQIDGALNQALALVVTRQACSLVLERDGAYGWNNAMDITDAVTGEMDAVLATVALQ